MANLITINLSKNAGASWGFRLQGGKDFATPLCIQKVNGASLAEQAGLQAGDAIVSIGGQDALSLRHKEAQDAIVRAGNNFEIVVQRGASVWKPQVTPLSEKTTLPDGVPVATKTSLAHDHKASRPIGSGHNTTAAPFREKMVNLQYNSPLPLYSEDSIAETLSAQAEVLDKGVLGVNFMKNDKNYDGRSSDVLRMVQEMDREPQCETPGTPTNVLGTSDRPVVQGYSFKLLQRVLDDGATPPPQHQPADPGSQVAPGEQLPAGGNVCSACQRLIVGVFVRIKNKNLHAECFKCATCGASLKNVGYYNINDKLYCDIHAKQAAKNNPPAPNMVPVTVEPGATPPTGSLFSGKMKIPCAFQHDNGPAPAPAPALAPASPAAASPPPAVSPLLRREVPEPSPESVPECSPSPAPEKPFVPAPVPAALAPVAAPPMKPASMAPSSGSAANPHGFGAPAGVINVKTHIPKKGDVPAPAPVPVPAPMTFAPLPAPVPGFGSKPAQEPVIVGKVLPGGAARGGLQAPGQKSAPRRGRGVMNQASASRIPMCAICQRQIRGPFVSALGKTWCPDHFSCATSDCRKDLTDMGFVEERGELYCEHCYESYLAPICGKCDKRVKGDCLNAVGKQFHPECFCCTYCGKVFGSGTFYLEDGLPYCEMDWNNLFTTKCVGCNFPIEAGDRWVEALDNNYHSQCFKCSKCQKNLEGQSFFAKGGKPFCKAHAQRGF